MISIESTGKTVQKAIEEGLEKLQKSIDEVDINILSSGGLFKKARVQITVIESPSAAKKTVNAEAVRTEKAVESKAEKPAEQAETSKVNAQPLKQVKEQEQNQPKPQKQAQKPPQAKQEKPEKQEKAEKNNKNENSNTQKQDRPQRQNRDSLNRKPEKAEGEAKQNRGDAEKKPLKNKEEKPRTDNSERKEKRPEKTGEEVERRDRIKTPVSQEVESAATEFVQSLLQKMNVDFTLESTVTDGELTVSIKCDSGAIIGYRGETLDAIEYLTTLSINKSDDKFYRINVDCNDYRSKRIETLTSLARRMAEKAIKTGRKVVLEPMSSSNRKIIHSVLAENDRIITRSEGNDPTRRILIIPKRFNKS